MPPTLALLLGTSSSRRSMPPVWHTMPPPSPGACSSSRLRLPAEWSWAPRQITLAAGASTSTANLPPRAFRATRLSRATPCPWSISITLNSRQPRSTALSSTRVLRAPTGAARGPRPERALLRLRPPRALPRKNGSPSSRSRPTGPRMSPNRLPPATTSLSRRAIRSTSVMLRPVMSLRVPSS